MCITMIVETTGYPLLTDSQDPQPHVDTSIACL